jgi:hypothetical protein
LYDEVVEVAKTYIGPVAERFVARQVTSHLNLTVERLEAQHLEELGKWCYLSGRLIMEEARAQEFAGRVKGLRARPTPSSRDPSRSGRNLRG